MTTAPMRRNDPKTCAFGSGWRDSRRATGPRLFRLWRTAAASRKRLQEMRAPTSRAIGSEIERTTLMSSTDQPRHHRLPPPRW